MNILMKMCLTFIANLGVLKTSLGGNKTRLVMNALSRCIPTSL